MSITVDNLFYGAYRDAGLVKHEGTGLSDDQTEEARQLYNRMIDSWRADGLTISHISRKLYPITPGQGDYTIGPSGDWDTVWPTRVERMSIVLSQYSPEPEYPIFPLTVDEWQDWTYKKQVTNWPRRYFYERDFPLGILHLLYVPSDANSAAIYEEQPLSQIDATGDALLEFQPGYQEAIETNLAKRIAARFPGQSSISRLTLELSESSLDLIKNNNNRPLQRTTDFARSGRSDIYNGNRYGTR